MLLVANGVDPALEGDRLGGVLFELRDCWCFHGFSFLKTVIRLFWGEALAVDFLRVFRVVSFASFVIPSGVWGSVFFLLSLRAVYAQLRCLL